MSAAPRPFAEAALRPSGASGRTRALARAIAREWRGAPWTVRASVICILIFYLFAAASPVVAPYDPANQYRNLPDCPPMALHLTPRAEWAHGFFFAYPMTMQDPLARRFVEDHSRKTYIVGTLVDVGVGKIRPGDLLGILHACDRSAAGRVGVPQGLCLWEVGY